MKRLGYRPAIITCLPTSTYFDGRKAEPMCKRCEDVEVENYGDYCEGCLHDAMDQDRWEDA